MYHLSATDQPEAAENGSAMCIAAVYPHQPKKMKKTRGVNTFSRFNPLAFIHVAEDDPFQATEATPKAESSRSSSSKRKHDDDGDDDVVVDSIGGILAESGRLFITPAEYEIFPRPMADFFMLSCYGPSGSGKSTFAARWVAEYCQRRPLCDVYIVSNLKPSGSSVYRDMIRSSKRIQFIDPKTFAEKEPLLTEFSPQKRAVEQREKEDKEEHSRKVAAEQFANMTPGDVERYHMGQSLRELDSLIMHHVRGKAPEIRATKTNKKTGAALVHQDDSDSGSGSSNSSGSDSSGSSTLTDSSDESEPEDVSGYYNVIIFDDIDNNPPAVDRAVQRFINTCLETGRHHRVSTVICRHGIFGGHVTRIQHSESQYSVFFPNSHMVHTRKWLKNYSNFGEEDLDWVHGSTRWMVVQKTVPQYIITEHSIKLG